MEWPGSATRLSVAEEAPSARGSNEPPEGGGEFAVASERLIEVAVLDALALASDEPRPSQGHEPGRYLVRVRVSPEALTAYRNWTNGSTLPTGTWLVAEHSLRTAQPAEQGAGAGAPQRNPSSTADLPPQYVMRRDPEGWLFAAATSKGLKIPVREGACQDCHTQARADSVFGPSRPVESRHPHRDELHRRPSHR